jgi:hypothetical protein
MIIFVNYNIINYYKAPVKILKLAEPPISVVVAKARSEK